MGSKSDWDTMRAASETLEKFGVPHESHVMSAHRTPELASEFATTAESRGIEVIIAAQHQGNERLISELADLTYHCLVLIAQMGLSPDDVAAELQRRHAPKEH